MKINNNNKKTIISKITLITMKLKKINKIIMR